MYSIRFLLFMTMMVKVLKKKNLKQIICGLDNNGKKC